MGQRACCCYAAGPGRDWLTDVLSAAGAQVQSVSVYRREAPHADAATLSLLRHLLLQPAGSMRSATWLLTASEGVRNLQGLLPQAGWMRRCWPLIAPWRRMRALPSRPATLASARLRFARRMQPPYFRRCEGLERPEAVLRHAAPVGVKKLGSGPAFPHECPRAGLRPARPRGSQGNLGRPCVSLRDALDRMVIGLNMAPDWACSFSRLQASLESSACPSRFHL
jgi:Uroporphyrinogen-III synthase HemD.